MGRAEDCDCEWEWPCCCDGGGVLLLELEAGEALARPAEMGMAWRGRGPPADDPLLIVEPRAWWSEASGGAATRSVGRCGRMCFESLLGCLGDSWPEPGAEEDGVPGLD
jgi:hypothetical protein